MKVTKKGKLSFKLPDKDLKLVWLSAAKAAYYHHRHELQEHELYLMEEAIASLQHCNQTITLRRSEMTILTQHFVLRFVRPESVILLRQHLGNLKHEILELPPLFT